MGWIDQVPRAGNLFIGGLYSLKRREAIQNAKITHVVSVLRWPVDEQLIRPYKHLQIDVDDDEDENLLQYFPVTNPFIDAALDEGGSVYIHCAMGKSRSATVMIAYLMFKYHISPQQALDQIRESRGVCEPNPGFWKQLELYHQMHTPSTVEDNTVYQRWLYQRDLAMSREARTAPEIDKIRFEDEHATDTSEGDFELRCRKCRKTLGTSQFLVAHEPKQVNTPIPPSACAHYFLEPLSWMRTELEQGKLDGRLECFKCKTNVGKYAWQGMQCSCGDWVLPGISLSKSRVDQVKLTSKKSIQSMGIRLPPGMTPEKL